ncbi:MAG: ATP synthase F1 subunit gamma [Candidatus Pacebacteria bacterium]|nr:ATP synthase F1 subunit gamma [Candidatus Paceibacterota bacterium]
MANARQIKRRIGAASNISKITKAMEMVAASKMKRAQDQAILARSYALALQDSLQKLASQSDPSLHPLLSSHDEGIDILLVIGTNKGLCGSLNTQLFKQMDNWVKSHPNGEIIAVGKKIVNFCRLGGFTIHAQYTDIPEKMTSSDLVPISTMIIENFLNKKYKSVGIVFMDFINTLSQKPKISKVLPMSKEETSGDKEKKDENQTKVSKVDYLFEPDAGKILSSLLPFYIENSIYQAFLESRASEHSARMVTMKNASENAYELVDELKLVFNKSRQAAITNELLEITTASLSL